MTHPMMKCGHAANATSGQKPICAICVGIHPGAEVVDDAPPNLDGRFATCGYGEHGRVPSSTSLAFFEHHPKEKTDSYYCGCRGWD